MQNAFQRLLVLFLVFILMLLVITGCQGGEDASVTIAPPVLEDTSWIRTFGQDSATALQDGVRTPDGGYLFVGASDYSHQNTDQEDLVIVKMDEKGELLWQKVVEGERFDRGTRVVVTEGGYLVLGETRSLGAGERDLYLLKIDAEGSVLWSQTYGGPREEQAGDFLTCDSGGALLVGLTRSFGAGGSDLYLVRTDDQGQVLWDLAYGTPADEEGYAALERGDGSYLVLGAQLHEGWDYLSMNPDISLTAVSDDGELLWSKTLDREGVQSAFHMAALPGGDVLLAGLHSSSGEAGDTDPLLIRIDPEGDVVWEELPDHAGSFDYASDVFVSGPVVLVTGLWSQAGEGGVLWMRLDDEGALEEDTILARQPGDLAGLSILPGADEGYLIVANARGSGQGWYTLLVKTNGRGGVRE